MIGVDWHNGQNVGGAVHLQQSLVNILTTPKGTMPTNRAFGSDLPACLDSPINGETLIDIYHAVAEAIFLWEPRVSVARVNVIEARAGYLSVELVDENENTIPLYVNTATGTGEVLQ
ncbi:MAG: GPW/gp25 family protein [Planktomarina sp.]